MNHEEGGTLTNGKSLAGETSLRSPQGNRPQLACDSGAKRNGNASLKYRPMWEEGASELTDFRLYLVGFRIR